MYAPRLPDRTARRISSKAGGSAIRERFGHLAAFYRRGGGVVTRHRAKSILVVADYQAG